MYISLPDSPQGIGDLTGLAFRLVRRNIGAIFRFILVPSIFTVAGSVLIQWVFSYGTSGIAESKNFTGALLLIPVLLVALVVSAIAWWILGLRLLALCRVTLGFAPTLDEAMKYMNRRKWGLAGLYILAVTIFSVAIFAWLIVMSIGIGIGSFAGSGTNIVKVLLIGGSAFVGIFGVIITSSFYLCASHLAYSVFACEDVPVTTVITRSLQMSFKHFVRILTFGMMFAFMYSILSYPLALPVAVAAFVDALQHGMSTMGEGTASAYKPPVYLLVLTQGWEAAMGIVLRPLAVFAFGLLYYDLRLRSEGIDIQRKLQLIEAKSEVIEAH